MTRDYQQLWDSVIATTDEAQTVPGLAGVLADTEGRAFILRLNNKDAGSCIEVLDKVSPNLHIPPSPPPQAVLSGHRRA